MATTWFDGTSTGYEAADIGPLFLKGTTGWFDPTYYGAEMDLRPIGATSTTLGSAVIPGTVTTGTSGDVGKLMLVRGAGSVALTASDGAITIGAPVRDNNLLNGSGFTSALNGRRITVTGALGGGTLTAFVWGVVSSTQLRLTANATTTVSGATYTISDDLYGTVLSNTTTNWTLDTVASTTTTSPGAWVATDDATAVNACIQAAITSAATRGIGPTVYFPRACGVGAPILVTGKCRLVGAGTQGYSALLATSSTLIRAMRPGLNAVVRAAFGGSGATGAAGCGLGVRGSITSGTAILTDPDAAWVAGDAGKRINIVGAGVQAGSQTQTALATTILSVDSSIQVTLAANATTTVTEGIYSWLGSAVSAAFNWFSMERLHVMGSAGQKCAIHLIATNGVKLESVTCSEFRSGMGLLSDGSIGGVTEHDINSCQFNNCRIGVKNGGTFNGTTLVDGMDNQIAIMPPAGTIGIDTSSMFASGPVIIQAYETCLRAEGRVNAKMLRCEAFQTGIQLGGDGSSGVLGGNGNQICVTSWSTSSTTGSAGEALVLLSGVQKTTFEPGYYVPTNIRMYDGSDATSLLSLVTNDPNVHGSQSATYTTPYTPNLALGKTIKMTLTGPVTVNAPTNATMGVTLKFIFLQDGVGGRVVTWDAAYKLNWTPTTTAAKRNSIEFAWDGTNWVMVGSAVNI